MRNFSIYPLKTFIFVFICYNYLTTVTNHQPYWGGGAQHLYWGAWPPVPPRWLRPCLIPIYFLLDKLGFVIFTYSIFDNSIFDNLWMRCSMNSLLYSSLEKCFITVSIQIFIFITNFPFHCQV